MSQSPTVKPLSRFWRSLERLPGQATTGTHWRHLLGPDHERVSSLLVPENRLASSIPRLDGSGRHYAVIEHGLNDFVGVCEGDRIVLSRHDLVIYRLDIAKLLKVIAKTLGITHESSLIPERVGTRRVGMHRPLAGFAFPILFTAQLETKDFKQELDSLRLSLETPFLLLTPTSRHLRTPVPRQCLAVSLEDVVTAPADLSSWRLEPGARDAIDSFFTQFLPSQKEDPTVFFATPPASTWSMLRIRFVDGHRVAVSVGEAAQTVNYTQMGMADRRNGNPTKQWELLRAFAREHGTMTWSSKSATRENQKRKEKLSDDLKAFFRIEGEPFALLEDGKGWEACFTLEPE